MHFLQTRFNTQFLYLTLVISGLEGNDIILFNFLFFLKEDLKQQEAYGPISTAAKLMLLNLFLLDNFVVKRTSTVPKTEESRPYSRAKLRSQ